MRRREGSSQGGRGGFCVRGAEPRAAMRRRERRRRLPALARGGAAGVQRADEGRSPLSSSSSLQIESNTVAGNMNPTGLDRIAGSGEEMAGRKPKAEAAWLLEEQAAAAAVTGVVGECGVDEHKEMRTGSAIAREAHAEVAAQRRGSGWQTSSMYTESLTTPRASASSILWEGNFGRSVHVKAKLRLVSQMLRIDACL